MTHARIAPAMGLTMGAMVPAMAHGPLAGAGIAVVAAHLTVAAILVGVAFVLPSIRARLARHRPGRAMIIRMAACAGGGFALICAHCVATLHGAARWT